MMKANKKSLQQLLQVVVTLQEQVASDQPQLATDARLDKKDYSDFNSNSGALKLYSS